MSADRDADWQGAIARARAHSPFLTLGLDRQPELAALLAAGQAAEALAYAGQAGSGAGDPAVALRLERWALATALGIGDLAGGFSLTDVMARL